MSGQGNLCEGNPAYLITGYDMYDIMHMDTTRRP